MRRQPERSERLGGNVRFTVALGSPPPKTRNGPQLVAAQGIFGAKCRVASSPKVPVSAHRKNSICEVQTSRFFNRYTMKRKYLEIVQFRLPI